jgi:arsenical pump membrane protein
MKKILLLAAVAALFSFNAQAQDTSTGTSSADTWVIQNSKTNNGKSNTIEIRTDTKTPNYFYGLMAFSFTKPNAGNTVTKATLRLTARYKKGDSAVELYDLNSAFDEGCTYDDVSDAITAALDKEPAKTFKLNSYNQWSPTDKQVIADFYTVDKWQSNVDITALVKAHASEGVVYLLFKKAYDQGNSSQYVLFLLIYLLTSVLTIFTSNDIVILTFTPFIIFFSKEAKINPLPYLVSEFVAANSWSMLLVIGNPTNIYLATSFGITFFDYLKAMALPTVLAGLASLGMMLLMFGHFLKVPFETTSAEPTLKDPFLAYVSLAILFLTIVAMAFSNFFDLPIWLVSLGGALVLILVTLFYGIRKKEAYRYLGHSLKRLPYPVIPFILSMFVLVMSLKYVGVISKLADLLAKTNPYLGVGLSSYLAANFLNNIPMSVLYTEIFRNMSSLTPTMIYLAIISSNLGAFLTPIGALAGVMWTGILRNYGMKFSIRDFFRYLSPVSLVSLGMAFLGLYL